MHLHPLLNATTEIIECKKVCWYPRIREGQQSHKIEKCAGTPMSYTTALSAPSSSADLCESLVTQIKISRMSCYAEFNALSSVLD